MKSNIEKLVSGVRFIFSVIRDVDPERPHKARVQIYSAIFRTEVGNGMLSKDAFKLWLYSSCITSLI